MSKEKDFQSEDTLGDADIGQFDYPIDDAINEMKERRLTEQQEQYKSSNLKIKKVHNIKPKKSKNNQDPPIVVLQESQLPRVKQFYKPKKPLVDVSLLVGDEWLNSSQVARGMDLIQNQFKNCNILTGSPYFKYDRNLFDKNQLYSQSGNHIISANTFFVLNSCGNHWVLLTNYDCDIDIWHFYDSLNGIQYLNSMELILGHIAPMSPETQFQIMYNREVQRQKGSDDCGLFVLAYIYSLCNIFVY